MTEITFWGVNGLRPACGKAVRFSCHCEGPFGANEVITRLGEFNLTLVSRKIVSGMLKLHRACMPGRYLRQAFQNALT